MFLYGKKSFILKNFFTEKTFFTEKNINENGKNIYLMCISCVSHVYLI